jgi:ubiquinone biosynthesis protein COQ4
VTRADRLELEPAPPCRPLQWRRGLAYLQALLDEPEATVNAMDLQLALGAPDLERQFERLARDPMGRRLLLERPDLLAVLSDRDALAALPEGSLGRALHDYFDRFDFDPRSLVRLWREVRARWEHEEEEPPLDPLRRWYHERTLMLHDVSHVISGYDADGIGEATLLAFSVGQQPGRVNRLLTIGAGLRTLRGRGLGWLGYLFRAYRRGRGALWLHVLPWEEMLDRPLEEVRAAVALQPLEVAHPGGVLRAPSDTAPSPELSPPSSGRSARRAV